MNNKLSKPGDSLSTGTKFKIGGLAGRAMHIEVPTAPPHETLAKDDLELALSMRNRIMLMPDCSGSMRSYADESGRRTRNDCLQEAVIGFVQNCDFDDTAVAVETIPLQACNISVPFTRNQVFLEMTGHQLGTPGDTPIGHTMQHVLNNTAPTRCVLISDGEATDGTLCLDVARAYRECGIAVDCVHIGDDNSGEHTLKQIAELTGGIYIKFSDVNNFAKSLKYLTPKNYGLLMAPGAARLLGASEVKRG